MTQRKTTSRTDSAARLMPCDLDKCQGICCSDGAFLRPEEVRSIRKLVARHPDHFDHLPADFIIRGEWAGGAGMKTNVRRFRYRSKPAHFKHTRCVFTESDGKCSLQTLAIKQGVHKWKYKPMGCWLFPLESEEHGLVKPPRSRREDPNNLGPEYPGFATFTPCGKHRPNGKVWWIALREEVRAYHAL